MPFFLSISFPKKLGTAVLRRWFDVGGRGCAATSLPSAPILYVPKRPHCMCLLGQKEGVGYSQALSALFFANQASWLSLLESSVDAALIR